MRVTVFLFISALAGSLSIAQSAKATEVSQNPTGSWKTVDYVREVNDFNPEKKNSQEEFFFKQAEFRANGKINPFPAFTWNNGWITDSATNTRAEFYIRQINSSSYMFFPWLSGDVTIRHQKPMYYVLQEVSSGVQTQTAPQAIQRPSKTDINAKVAQLDIDSATIDDVIRIFGNPREYRWDRQTFTRNNLPSQYLAIYTFGLNVCMSDGKIEELRFEKVDSGYVFSGKIRIGSSLDEVLESLGQPKETVTGGKNEFQDGILYKDINGQTGFCYYGLKDKGVRLFFVNYKVSSLYVTRTSFDAGSGGGGSFQTVRPVGSVKEFEDVRFKDLSKLNPSVVAALVSTLWFNEKTVWPDTNVILPGRKPYELLKKAMNPGLGVGQLHKEGITGKGVNVAIIDQPLYQDHPEFAGKIAAYYDVGCGSESSMHGPAVVSLFVGTNCGTAPDAKLYYVAAPSWLKDSSYFAKALDWIIEQNTKLPNGQKIRVVSVSGAPSGEGSPFEKNQQMWDAACSRAEAAGILVLDCTHHHGFIGACWLDWQFYEDALHCRPGYPDKPNSGFKSGDLLAPTCPRTTAEQYNKGEFSYQFCGSGGLSWAIPYVAGVMAMGWQVNPDLSGDKMKRLLFDSAAITPSGEKIINPARFIAMVKSTKTDVAGFATDPMQQRR